MTNFFKKMIDSNKYFWRGINNNNSKYLLYEMFHSDPRIIYGNSKIALSIAHSQNLNPLCIRQLRASRPNLSLLKSMNSNLTGGKVSLFVSSLLNCLNIIKHIVTLTSKERLLGLKIDGCSIGSHIYDAVLRTLYLQEIESFTPSVRKCILLEICYFYFFQKVLNDKNIKIIVLGDNVYRCGLLYELAKSRDIVCVAPINLTNFSLRKCLTKEDFNIHNRTPDLEMLERLDNDVVINHLDQYFKERFSANIEQHDVLNAFSKTKEIYSKSDLVKQYNLNKDFPIVVVMCHIFCDAPHGYPNLLYQDYKDWLVNTVNLLKSNTKVNFLVKEHPSADLYNEQGVVNKILKKLGCNHLQLSEDVHTTTILQECDVVVTCGGTIGLEFAYFGKPVVLAANPPYSGFGFTTEPNSAESYEDLLKNNIQNLSKLTESEKKMAYKVLYHDFVLLDNYSNNLELVGERLYMGKKYDQEVFCRNVLKYNESPLREQEIYKVLDNFMKNKEKNFIARKL